jgi:hypothetical protein
MARKNANAKRQAKYNIPDRKHFLYSSDEFGADPVVVRYMGEQDGDHLKCWHPNGFEFWAHLHYLWNPPANVIKPSLVAA